MITCQIHWVCHFGKINQRKQQQQKFKWTFDRLNLIDVNKLYTGTNYKLVYAATMRSGCIWFFLLRYQLKRKTKTAVMPPNEFEERGRGMKYMLSWIFVSASRTNWNRRNLVIKSWVWVCREKLAEFSNQFDSTDACWWLLTVILYILTADGQFNEHKFIV